MKPIKFIGCFKKNLRGLREYKTGWRWVAAGPDGAKLSVYFNLLFVILF
jgi:hypothetical protein